MLQIGFCPPFTYHTAMTTAELAALLSRLVGEAEDAGLDPQEILAEVEGRAALPLRAQA